MPELEDLDHESLDAMLRDAADGATRRAVVPPYDLVQGLARRRRTARVAAAGVFGVVLCLAIGVAAVTGVGRDLGGQGVQPAASTTTTAPLDPSLRQYWTQIPILTWTPDAGRKPGEVSRTNEFQAALYSGLGADREWDASQLDDLRKLFPDAPVGGPAIPIDQSVTRAQLEKAAKALRQLDGVRDARVVEVTGLWFTVSATGPTDVSKEPPTINLEGTVASGSASGEDRDAQNRVVAWVRATYVGPAIDRAAFDLLRTRAAEAVNVEVSDVVVTAESAAGSPEPTPS